MIIVSVLSPEDYRRSIGCVLHFYRQYHTTPMPSDPCPPTAETSVARYRALLQVTEAIASHHDLGELFHDLAQRLPHVLKCSSIAMALHDPERNVMRLHILEALCPGPVSLGIEFPVEEVPDGWVWQHQKTLVCTNVEQETRFPKVMPMIRQTGIRSFCGFWRKP